MRSDKNKHFSMHSNKGNNNGRLIRTCFRSFSDEIFSSSYTLHTTHESSTVVSYQYTDLNLSYVGVHIDVL